MSSWAIVYGFDFQSNSLSEEKTGRHIQNNVDLSFRQTCWLAIVWSWQVRWGRCIPTWRAPTTASASLAIKWHPIIRFFLPWHAENACCESRQLGAGSCRDSPGSPSPPRRSSRGHTRFMARTSDSCRRVKTAARLPSWTLAPINFYFKKKTINYLRLAVVVLGGETFFCVKQQARTHLVGGVKVHGITPRQTCCPTSQLNAKHRPCSDETTDFVKTFADWCHLVAENWQRNHAGERAAHRSLGLRWWNASVCSGFFFPF